MKLLWTETRSVTVTVRDEGRRDENVRQGQSCCVESSKHSKPRVRHPEPCAPTLLPTLIPSLLSKTPVASINLQPALIFGGPSVAAVQVR